MLVYTRLNFLLGQPRKVFDVVAFGACLTGHDMSFEEEHNALLKILT